MTWSTDNSAYGQSVNFAMTSTDWSQRGIVVLTNGENGEDVYKKVMAESLDLGAEVLGKMQ